MRVVNSVLLVLVGMAAGIALVVSCGDHATTKVDAAADGPPPADAAKCDCPAAEPPLAGRFIVVGNVRTIPANDTGGQSTVCPPGTQLIAGSCGAENTGLLYDLTLRHATFGRDPGAWSCDFRNNEAIPVAIKAQAICLRLTP